MIRNEELRTYEQCSCPVSRHNWYALFVVVFFCGETITIDVVFAHRDQQGILFCKTVNRIAGFCLETVYLLL